MPNASVIICTHNPRPHYLRRVLEGLRAQTLPADQWELILVDNASSEALSNRFDLSWHPHGRHVFESELGLSSARHRGMKDADSDLFIFVDDDNVLASSYLAEAVRINQEWPRLGTWGSGATVPEFESQPAPQLTKILPYLALRDVKVARWSNFPARDATPWGAGLCLRKSVADRYRKLSKEAKIVISDRKGSQLLSGGDVELAYVACDLGLGIGVFPELRLIHLIPKGRVEKAYLLKIVEGTELSTVLLEYKWKGIHPRSPLSARGLLSLLKNLLLQTGIDRELYAARLRGTMHARRLINASDGGLQIAL